MTLIQPTTIDVYGRDGLRLRADEFGDPDAPPVVLLHGGGQTRFAWGTTAPVLAGRGWRVFRVDLRGHGESDWPDDGDYGPDAFAGDVTAIATALPRAPGAGGRVTRWDRVDPRHRPVGDADRPRPRARRRRAEDRAGRRAAHRRVHERAHGIGVRVPRRGRRRRRRVQPAPPAPDRPLGAQEERASARRRPVGLALGPALHVGETGVARRDACVARARGEPQQRGAPHHRAHAPGARPGERPAERGRARATCSSSCPTPSTSTSRAPGTWLRATRTICSTTPSWGSSTACVSRRQTSRSSVPARPGCRPGGCGPPPRSARPVRRGAAAAARPRRRRRPPTARACRVRAAAAP